MNAKKIGHRTCRRKAQVRVQLEASCTMPCRGTTTGAREQGGHDAEEGDSSCHAENSRDGGRDEAGDDEDDDRDHLEHARRLAPFRLVLHGQHGYSTRRMPKRVLRFHFDYISPYSYLAWQQLGEFANEHDLRVEPKPTLLRRPAQPFRPQGAGGDRA